MRRAQLLRLRALCGLETGLQPAVGLRVAVPPSAARSASEAAAVRLLRRGALCAQLVELEPHLVRVRVRVRVRVGLGLRLGLGLGLG